ncbi:MAG: DUF547 domain-containing protein [bacterium]|nr:DUF547 domain-containing protein [bacterium]
MKASLRLLLPLLFALGWSFPLLAFDLQYGSWNAVLEQAWHQQGHQTYLDYASLKADRTSLNRATEEFRRLDRAQFDSWNESQQLAFWINAYNLFSVQLVVEHYPVESIKEIGPFYRSPFGLEFFQLFGQDYSLDEIEHQKLRAQFTERRIHFALVCASLSCPNLIREPYRAETLEQQLETSLRAFLKDPNKNRQEAGRLKLSKIFDWFDEDFESLPGGLSGFISPRWPAAKPLIEAEKIEWLEYDWSLNDWNRK